MTYTIHFILIPTSSWDPSISTFAINPIITGLFNLSSLAFLEMQIKLSFADIIRNIVTSDSEIGKYYCKKQIATKYSFEHIYDSIMYVLKTGIAWRYLNSGVGWQSAFFHFKRWSRRRIFEKAFNKVRRKVTCGTAIIVDTTFIINKNGKNKVARNKLMKNKNCLKISMVTDVNGIPLSVLADKGTKHDLKFVGRHIKDLDRKLRKQDGFVLADRGYISKQLKQTLDNKGWTLMTKVKRNMRDTYVYDPNMYKRRIRIENTFQMLKTYRRIQLRYDRKHSTYLSFVYMAVADIVHRRL
jgi:transposase